MDQNKEKIKNITNQLLDNQKAGTDSLKELNELKSCFQTKEDQDYANNLLKEKVKQGTLTQANMDALSKDIFDVRFNTLEKKTNDQSGKKESEAIEKRLTDLQKKDVETIEVDANKFYFDEKAFNQIKTSPNPSAMPTLLETSWHDQSADSQVFQTEANVIMNGYVKFSEEIKGLSESKSVGGKILDFGKSLFKTLTAPLYVPARLVGLVGPSDTKTKALQQKCERVKKLYTEKTEKLKQKKQRIEQHGKMLQQAVPIIAERKKTEKEEKEQEINHQQIGFDTEKTELETKRTKLEDDVLNLQDAKANIEDYKTKISTESEKAEQTTSEIELQKQGLEDHAYTLEGILTTIDRALEKMPKDSPKREELQKKRDSLLDTQERVSDTSILLSEDQEKIKDMQKKYSESEQETLKESAKIENQEGDISDSIGTIDETIGLLNQGKENNEEQKMNLENETNAFMVDMQNKDDQIKKSMQEINKQNETALKAVQETGKGVQSLEVKIPNLWDETYGGIAKGLGQGLNFLGKTVLPAPFKLISNGCNSIKEKNIPILSEVAGVLGFSADVVTGVYEGATELVTGITTMIEKPVETVTGMGSLIGRDVVSGEWSFKTVGQSWNNLGRAIVAADEFEIGNYGLGVGKAMANIGSFFIPGSGAGNAAKLAFASTKGMSITGRILIGGTKSIRATTMVVGERMLVAGKTLFRMPGTALKTIPGLGERIPGALRVTTKADLLTESLTKIKTMPFGAKSSVQFEKVFGTTADDLINSSQKIVINPEGLSASNIARAVKIERDIMKIRKINGIETTTEVIQTAKKAETENVATKEIENNIQSITKKEAKKVNKKIKTADKEIKNANTKIEELQAKIEAEKVKTKKFLRSKGPNESKIKQWESEQEQVRLKIKAHEEDKLSIAQKYNEGLAPYKIKEFEKDVANNQKIVDKIQKEYNGLDVKNTKNVSERAELKRRLDELNPRLELQKAELAEWKKIQENAETNLKTAEMVEQEIAKGESVIEKPLEIAQESIKESTAIIEDMEKTVEAGIELPVAEVESQLVPKLDILHTELERYKELSLKPGGKIVGVERYYLEKLDDIRKYLTQTESGQKQLVNSAWIGKLNKDFREVAEGVSKMAA